MCCCNVRSRPYQWWLEGRGGVKNLFSKINFSHNNFSLKWAILAGNFDEESAPRDTKFMKSVKLVTHSAGRKENRSWNWKHWDYMQKKLERTSQPLFARFFEENTRFVRKLKLCMQRNQTSQEELSADKNVGSRLTIQSTSERRSASQTAIRQFSSKSWTLNQNFLLEKKLVLVGFSSLFSRIFFLSLPGN